MLIANIHTMASHIWVKMRSETLLQVCPVTVVIKLMQPLFNHDYNVTCDNFSTSLDIAVRLAKEKCSLVGTIGKNRRDFSSLLHAAKAKQQLHEKHFSKSPPCRQVQH